MGTLRLSSWVPRSRIAVRSVAKLALGIAVLYLTRTISGTLAIVLGLVAVLFFATSLVGWCLAYLPFDFSTRKGSAGPPPPDAELRTR